MPPIGAPAYAGALVAARPRSAANPMIHPQAELEPGAVVGPDTSVWPGTVIRRDARVGAGCNLGRLVYVGAGVVVGDRCKIENQAMLFEGARVGDGVFIGPGAVLANDRYPRAVTPDGKFKSRDDWVEEGVTVEEGASLGARSTILPGLRIGAWAVVAAGAVVTRDVPSHAIVAGLPARRVGTACRCGRPMIRADDRWSCEACGRSYSGPEESLVEVSG